MKDLLIFVNLVCFFNFLFCRSEKKKNRSMDETEYDASCIICQLMTILSVFAILLFLLSLNSKCLYLIKMICIYCTILLNAVIVCFAWPLYFFGDVSGFKKKFFLTHTLFSSGFRRDGCSNFNPFMFFK